MAFPNFLKEIFTFWHYIFEFLDDFLLILLVLAVFFSYELFPYLCTMETFNITLPTSWAELSDKQLLIVYGLFARDLSAAEVKTLCLMKWNGLKVLATLPRHRFLIKRGKEQVVLSTRQIQQATSVLDFLDRLVAGLPRIRSLAGLRNRKRNSPWNHGDIGHIKKRVAKKWFSRKYYSSVLNLRDFLADNIGQSFVGVVAKALDDNYRRYHH